MSLFCDSGYDHDGADWWWYQPADEAPLATKRSRKCCSCGEKVGAGNTAKQRNEMGTIDDMTMASGGLTCR